MYSRIILWQQGASRVSLRREADGAVYLDLTRDGYAAALALAGLAWNDIPEILLVAVGESAEDAELKASDETLRGAYGLLRGRLKDVVLMRGADLRFFGLPLNSPADETQPESSGACLEARLSLALPDIGEAPSIGLDATAVFAATIRSNGATCHARLSLRFAWSGEIPQIELALPLPGLSLAFLQTSLPDFELFNCRFDLGLPGWGSEIAVEWAVEPKLRVEVADNQIGVIVAAGDDPDRPASGKLKIAGQDLITITELRAGGSLNDLAYTLRLESGADLTTTVPKLLPLGPFDIDWASATIDYAFDAGGGLLSATTQFDALKLSWKTPEPGEIEAALILVTTYDLASGAVSTDITKFELTGINLQIVPILRRAAAGLQRLIFPLQLAGGDVDAIKALLAKLSSLGQALLAWLAGAASGAGSALAGLASGAADLFAALGARIAELAEGALADDYFLIELRWDSRRGALRQIVFRSLSNATGEMTFGSGELVLTLPARRWALLIDLEEHWVAFTNLADAAEFDLTLATDLWLEGETGATPVRDAAQGEHLLTAKVTCPAKLAMVALVDGKIRFFREIVVEGDQETINLGPHAMITAGLPYRLGKVAVPKEPDVTFAKDRLTSLFPVSDGGSDSLLSGIKIKDIEPTATSPIVEATIKLEVSLSNSEPIEAKLVCQIDLTDFSARLNSLEIPLPQDSIELLGSTAKIIKNEGKGLVFRLDDAPSFGLAKGASALLEYKELSSDGGSLDFTISDFAIDPGGLDLAAHVVPTPVRLPGLDTNFKFTEGAIRVDRNRVLSATISGAGELPRALLGEARVSAALQFGRSGGDDSGRFEVVSATARLEKTGEPLVCESTRFRFELSHVGLAFKRLEGRTQFYAELTGAAMFRPNKGEFGGGLMSRFAELRITLDRTPITGDGRALAKTMNFQVAINPPVKANLFNLFQFEVRGIGFHPSYSGWADAPPALAISGQVKFSEVFDTVNPKFDFHNLYIAGPPKGESLPRIRFDGLGVGLRIGSMAEFEATAVAVDKTLPTLFAPDVLPANVTAEGYLASGRVRLAGWAPMSASAGFLELENDERPGDRRLSFFAYAQQEQLSEAIPTPIGTFYLREIGFGFGFRYTLEALQRTDNVDSPGKLIELLDPISRRQGDLAKFTAWLPEPEGDRLTFAMRAMFSITSASSSSQYNAEEEKELANPVLFDVIAALRSDLTFLLSARAWLAMNYSDWVLGGASWSDKPLLRGYLYISAPKRTFLGRFISDPEGTIGEHPKLPGPLIEAIRAVRFSSTIYIRPGLFHQEFGWPYELELNIPERNGFKAKINGGLVLRIEDGAVLQGLAFRGRAQLDIGGSIGGSVGASLQAHADISLEGKFLAYVSVARPAQSLFYGKLGLAIALDIAISFWVKLRFFSLSASWREAITIELDLEVAIGPADGLGAHARASVSVQRFGRGLRVGISAGFNRDVLSLARSRVDRFMQLGLAATVPDPEGNLGPVAEASRKERAEVGDKAVTARAQSIDSAPPLPEPGDEQSGRDPAIGAPVSGCDFWAILMPMGQDALIVQLMPRDRGDTLGGFFVAPGGTYKLVGLGAPEEALLREAWQSANKSTFPTLVPAWDAKLDDKTDPPITLRELVGGAFMGNDAGEPTQPPSRAQLPALLAPAVGRPPDAASLLADTKGALEARGALLGHAGDLALRHAKLGAPPAGELFTADLFALTFILREGQEGLSLPAQVDLLFPDGKAGFTIVKSDAKEEPGEVALFNPLDRMFINANPQLTDNRVWPEPAGIKLDWDLEPFWAREDADPLNDPEYHLHHYVMNRYIALENGEHIAQRRWTSKRAASCPDSADGSLNSERPLDFQALDDLSDLPPDLKAAILASRNQPPQGKAGRDQFEAWLARFGDKAIELVYTILPVDNAGTSNSLVPESLELRVDPPDPPTPSGFLFAKVRFIYRLPNTAVDPRAWPEPQTKPTIHLVLPRLNTDSPDAASFHPRLDTSLGIEIAIETRSGLARSGYFGADPGENDWNGRLDPDDIKALPRYVLKAGAGASLRARFETETESWPLADPPAAFWAALGIDHDRTVRSVRLFARPDYGAMDSEAPWVACDLELDLGNDQQPVVTPITSFERPLAFADRAALHHEDITAEEGRLWSWRPGEAARLANDKNPCDDLAIAVDSEDRSGIRLRWEARPRRSCKSASIDPDHIAGFELSMASRARERIGEDAARRFVADAQPLGTVLTKPVWQARSEPSAIEDFSKLEAYYPSDAARARAARAGKAWLSPAESLLVWPDASALRRSVMLVPDEGMIAELFAGGTPTMIRYLFEEGVKEPRSFAPDDLTEANDLLPGVTEIDPAAIRWALIALVTDLTAPQLTLHLFVDTARTGKDGARSSIATPILRTSDLHPVLADTVDLLRYERETFGDPQGNPDRASCNHRRYEPVLEGMPSPTAGAKAPAGPTGAAVRPDFARLLDDTLPERDKAGWCALRHLGLAVGLRLYDTRKGDWFDCDADKAEAFYAQFNWAFATALDRYTSLEDPVDVGTPYFEQIFDPEALFSLARHDGSPPGERPSGLPLVQLSLRPHSDHLTGDGLQHVHYARIAQRSPGAVLAVADSCSFYFELASIDSQLGSVAHTWAGSGAIEGLAAVQELLLPADAGEIVVRIVSLDAAVSGEQAAHALADLIAQTEETPVVVESIAALSEDAPLGRFGDLPAVLLYHIERDEGGFCARGNRRLRQLAERRFVLAKPSLQETEKLQAWSRRFIDHGSARPDHVTERAVGYATATITGPASLRRAPDGDGRISILYVDKSRLGNWLRFVIRPVGRYDELRRAANLLTLAEMQLAANQLVEAASSDNSSWVDATLPRTLPVASPTVLSAELAHDSNALVVISALSDEEVLAQANAPQHVAQQIAHSAIGWHHTLRHEKWVGCFHAASDAELTPAETNRLTLDELATLDAWIASKATPPKDGEATSGGLPDLWRGANIWAAYDLPYFMTFEASLWSAAGVTHSPKKSVALPSPKARFAPLDPPAAQATASPHSIEISFPLLRYADLMDAASSSAWYAGATGAAKRLFDLPDPDILYRLLLVSSDSGARSIEIDIAANVASGEGVYAAALVGFAFTSAEVVLDTANPEQFQLKVTLVPARPIDLTKSVRLHLLAIRGSETVGPAAIRVEEPA